MPASLNDGVKFTLASDEGPRDSCDLTSLVNAPDPHAWLTGTLTAIVHGNRQSQIADLLPWNYAANV